ncbi:MAG: ABC transporter ATP-binding protein [Bacteroidia bacterium]
MKHLLEVKYLSVSYTSSEGKLNAVKDLSFSLNESETIGIVGESGSGKSTTALAIMGLLEPSAEISSKSISWFNETGQAIDLAKNNQEGLKKIRGKEIAMVFQNPASSLNPVMRCGKQVMEPLIQHLGLSKKEAFQRCLELFSEAGLQDPERIAKSYPNEISGGQIQRVMIAMAMSCNPRLLIADEPTTALDVTVQVKILDLLKNLKEKYNMSMIFISHDMAVVSQVADRVLVMKQGRLIEEGSVEKVLTNPEDLYTKALLNCRPPLNKRFTALPTVEAYLENPSFEAKEVLPVERQKRIDSLFSSKPLLEVKGLSVSYAKRKGLFSLKQESNLVLKDVSFDLFKGETLGLVGESGSGKTTLGKALIRLIPSDEGEILFNDFNFLELSGKKLRRQRKEIQMVFQDPFASFNPRFNIIESLLEPMRLHNILFTDKERIQFIGAMLDKVGLSLNVLRKFPSEFSGGEIQRLAIARALLLSPSCIIFDESVSSLDVSVQALVLNLINDIKKEMNLSCIFISHDLSVVRYMSDRIIVLNEGSIVEAGEADEIFSKPTHQYTQKLLEAIPRFRFNSKSL